MHLILQNVFFHIEFNQRNWKSFGNYGTYGSLSGLPTLFDGNFSSLSGILQRLQGMELLMVSLKLFRFIRKTHL